MGPIMHSISFQHPDVFTKVIALSGVYDARFFVGDYYNDDAIYQKLTCRLYLESKRRMVYRSLPSGRNRHLYGPWCLGTRRSPSSTSLKKPLTRNKFQPGLLNGDTMSPTTGNGGVNKCPIFLDTCIYKRSCL